MPDLQLVLYLGVLVAVAKPLGEHIARVFEGKPLRFERAIYRLCGVNPDEERPIVEHLAMVASGER